ncbi:MAG: glutathione S-transferase family protein [Pseudomonadota bacterium]
MSTPILYHYPLRACSSVTVNALVETGMEFEDRVIDIRAGEQNTPAYRAIHPYGTVPALQVDDHVLTENVAILLYIDSLRPDVLFPATDSALQRAQYQADLIWCTASMHPSIRRLRMPIRYTDGDVTGVREKGLQATTHVFDTLEQRLAAHPWWYGERWSIVDVYVNWGIMTAASTDLLPMQDYPAIRAHIKRVRSRAVFIEALERQTQAKERAGLSFPDEASWRTDFD